MTTNETFFFRDKIPFDHLRETILPALVQARASRRALRIWCAASSTGQEPYSIAMCLKEIGAALAGWRVEIVATDLSQACSGKIQGRHLQPVRGAARLADPDAGQAFHASRRAVAAQCRYPRHGPAPAAESAAGLFPSRHLRRDLLPQRPDLFRSGHQGRHLRPPRKGDRARRRAGAGRGRIRGRDFRCLQALSGAARALPPERRPAVRAGVAATMPHAAVAAAAR